jgi:enamine deaminase RidA (YjgF/YER057c/UK114 family)
LRHPRGEGNALFYLRCPQQFTQERAGKVALCSVKNASYAAFTVAKSFRSFTKTVPVDPKTGSVPEDVAAQARQSLDNVKAIVEAAGLKVLVPFPSQ